MIFTVQRIGAVYGGLPLYLKKSDKAGAKTLDISFNVGQEVEFFLFHQDENGQPTSRSPTKKPDILISVVDLGENARRDMVLTLEDIGV